MHKEELKFIRASFLISTLLCFTKFVAWYFTHSLVILSDALESIINVAGSAFAWYSISLSAKPRDEEHPYGHGKIEFFSIGFEGALIFIAGIGILYESVKHFIQPVEVHQIGIGLWMVVGTGLSNFFLGYYLIRKGKQKDNLTLQGNGKHIMSDSYTSMGVLIALVLILFTGIKWIDPLASTIAGMIIIYTGFRLIRKSVSGLMDEADPEMVNEIILLLQEKRKTNWIDLHNLRVQRYGNYYHVDCHLTLPFYFSLSQVHDELTELDKLLNEHYKKGSIEFFIHTDPCIPESCSHCLLAECAERKFPFKKQLEWNRDNLLPNKRHTFPE
jgi:cation diffusion facilitator family transporter